MRKDGTSPQRNSRCISKKDVDKGIKRSATTSGKTVLKKRKTLNSLATPTGISDIEQSSKSLDQKSKAKVKKRLVPSKTTETSKILLKKVPTQSVKLKHIKTKKEVSQKLVKVKPKKVVIEKLGKKTVKPNQDKQKSNADKSSKDVKSTKKPADKMVKEQGKKNFESSPDRKASEVVKIKVNKKPKLVKKIGKIGEKKTCIVSVKIIKKVIPSKLSNVKKIPKKVVKKSSQKSIGNEDSSKNSVEDKSDAKKGIASRRKSLSNANVSKDSSPARSPARDTSPIRSKSKKPENKIGKGKEKLITVKSKIKEDCKLPLQDVKNGEIKDNTGTEKKKLKEDIKKIIQDDVKTVKLEIKKEMEDNPQKYQAEEAKTNPKISLSKIKLENNIKNEDIKSERIISSKIIEDCNNDSSTSDEIPLEFLKQKINLEEDNGNEEKEKLKYESIGSGKQLGNESDESNVIKGAEEKDKGKVKSKKESSVPSEKKTSKKDDSVSKKTITKKSTKKDTPVKVKTTVKRKELIDDKIVKQKVAKLVKKSKLGEIKNRKLKAKVLKDNSFASDKSDSDRRMRLFGFWSGPKRHRVASLNATAKVHCLYENESRSSLLEIEGTMSSSSNTTQSSSKHQKRPEPRKVESKSVKDLVVPVSTNTRSLRSVPGLRGVGRHYDIMNVSSTTSTSSSSDDASDSGDEKKLALQPSVKQKQQQAKKRQETDSSDEDDKHKKNIITKQEENAGKKVKKRRKRHELVMDLKDMVVRKRMASLNASAILAASYSFEKRPTCKKGDNVESTEQKERKKKKKKPVESSPDMEVEDSSADEDVVVRPTNGSSSKQKVSVIVNQDTDVTITGVYVNSTTRSTHHEGFCSIAGMQYRISSTSHTQTEATAVATETVLHTEHPTSTQTSSPSAAPPTLAPPCKSYTPLSALSNMQPPGHHHPQPCVQPPPRPPPLSPLGRRHGCSSAFTAPPNYGPHQPPPAVQDPSYIHGYYQPAGPLISHHHHHHSSSSSSVSSKQPPAPSTLPTPTPPPSSAPHPTSESSDSEVIITTASSESTAPLPYRYPQPYPSYNYQYYPSPPATASLQYPTPSQNHYHHQEVCYSTPPSYPPSYFHHKSSPYPPPAGYHRRYGPPPPQYYPQEFYSNPQNPSGNPLPPPSQQQMIVTAPAGTTSSAYPLPDSNYPPPPPPLVDPYPPPPPTYYPYSAGPPPPCYSHSPPTRSLAFIDAAYQSCPCPMQSCPKNVHTGPLTGASKGSLKNHQTTPLPPVALALPLEPPGALGPPSPARGSAGMPPPPSPALATARNPSSGQWADSPPVLKPNVDNKSETGLLAISKVLSESVFVADQDCLENTIVALNIPKTENVKIEVEDTSYSLETLDVKNNRKRRKSFKCTSEIKKQNVEVLTFPVEITEIKVQPEVQERLSLPQEKPEKTISSDSESPVEKQIPLSDNRATVPVKKQANKRKSVESDVDEPLTKVGKSVKKPKVKAGKKKFVKRDKVVTEENVEPTEVETSKSKQAVASKVNNRRRSSKVVERRKSSCSVREENVHVEDDQRIETAKKKPPARGKKAQEKTKADHMLRSHVKERRNSKSGKGSRQSTLTTSSTSKNLLEEDNDGETSALALLGPRKCHPLPKWSNGWSWEGQPYKAKVFITMDDGAVVRKCYPAMRHCQGDVIHPRDCVLLKSGPRKIDLPFVAKVAAMWENPEDGEMMVSLLWYYRPEHTEHGRRLEDIQDEIFASRHKDINSVACIEDKCFVLTFNEYCRYRKNARRLEECLSVPGRVVPTLEGGLYPRSERQPLGQVAPDLVFFCRRVYDFRQKRILKNPC